MHEAMPTWGLGSMKVGCHPADQTSGALQHRCGAAPAPAADPCRDEQQDVWSGGVRWQGSHCVQELGSMSMGGRSLWCCSQTCLS